MSTDRAHIGIALMIVTMLLFAAQDGVSRYLAETYNTVMIVMIRYWFLAVVVIAVSAKHPNGLRTVARSNRLFLQICRSVLLVAEILVMVTGFVLLGLSASHAIFACFPLIVVIFSAIFLQEDVGWRRWSAVCIGFIGVLIILRPGIQVFTPEALIPLLAALMFATYHVLTRLVSLHDSAETSYFWTGVAGAIAITLVGFWFWEPIRGTDIVWMILLCILSALGHYLLIQALTFTQASRIQPFSYLQLVFASIIGVWVFGETTDKWMIVGSMIVVASGLFSMLRERETARN